MANINSKRLIRFFLWAVLLTLSRMAAADTLPASAWLFGIQPPAEIVAPGAVLATPVLGGQLEVGDVVFIRVKPLPFRKVAAATGSWTNHVGVVVDTAGTEPVIMESTFPFSKKTPLSTFVARSESGRVAVTRLNRALSEPERHSIQQAAAKRSGIFYDTGFNLHSSRQFCSRLVREVIDEAVGVKLGSVDTFSTLLGRNTNADQRFWKIWFFGNIPWARETVTPASILESPALHRVFDGFSRQSV